jgi:DNA invertase Pin-like site-specific DNA recombinase
VADDLRRFEQLCLEQAKLCVLEDSRQTLDRVSKTETQDVAAGGLLPRLHSKAGKSGLGLEAQRKAVKTFAKAEGFTIVSEYTEIETGKGADALDRRPELQAALKTAKKAKGSIAVAKLDRLSRDVHFISGLMAQRVPFIVVAWARTSIRSCCTSTLRSRSRNVSSSAGAPAKR